MPRKFYCNTIDLPSSLTLNKFGSIHQKLEDTILGQLGEKRESYLCAMPFPRCTKCKSCKLKISLNESEKVILRSSKQERLLELKPVSAGGTQRISFSSSQRGHFYATLSAGAICECWCEWRLS